MTDRPAPLGSKLKEILDIMIVFPAPRNWWFIYLNPTYMIQDYSGIVAMVLGHK
jgi:hypothetical protein